MAISNKERIGKALDALLPKLRKYVERCNRTAEVEGSSPFISTRFN